jgi:hypothetical protein
VSKTLSFPRVSYNINKYKPDAELTLSELCLEASKLISGSKDITQA